MAASCWAGAMLSSVTWLGAMPFFWSAMNP